MKPQCETTPQCLRELARVMDQFGIDDLLDALQDYCLWDGKHINNPYEVFSQIKSTPEQLTLAIAEVEGKQVFPDDKMFDSLGRSCTVLYAPTKGTLWVEFENNSTYWALQTELSWNPPKPKTIMVELTFEDAAEFSGYGCFGNNHAPSVRLYQACKKALEKLK